MDSAGDMLKEADSGCDRAPPCYETVSSEGRTFSIGFNAKLCGAPF